ncbi:MAG: 4Fe-4S dicluster-binding protein [Nitrospinota bacterium]
MGITAVEIVYRGVFQKQLATKISRSIVLAARKEGKYGISFGRYGDSPERNGIPAKQFAYVAATQEELQEVAARYEPKEGQVDVSIVLDDTLCKGVESWGWYGLQPINKLTKEGGTVLVASDKEPQDLIPHIHRSDRPYNLAIVKGDASFAGLWVYKDDHTDARVLGAAVKVCPELVSMSSMEQAIRENLKDDEALVESARGSYEDVKKHPVSPGEGDPEEPFRFDLLTWKEMREGLAVEGIGAGHNFPDMEGGYQPDRNPYFRKWSTRTMRPVVQFDKCTKCTLCWIACPDSCFDVTPEYYYDANVEACCGCGVCEAICPVRGCITMVNETVFADRESQYVMWKKDPEAYRQWAQEKIAAGKVENRHPVTGWAGAFGELKSA